MPTRFPTGRWHRYRGLNHRSILVRIPSGGGCWERKGPYLDQVGSYMIRWTFLSGLLILLAATAAEAQSDPSAERGRAFAQIACGRCHAIGPTGDSPLSEAPPFRVLHQRYPVEHIQESLAEGIKTGHPMPEFQLDTDEIRDFLAYLKSLEH
jgi:mono/diheme cytochrome c family protein